MVYYKLILDTRRKRTDGIYPVVIRITFNRTHSTITTGFRLKEQHWDSVSQLVNKNNQNFQTINKSISETYLKVQKGILKLQELNEFSFEKLRIELSDKPIVKIKPITFQEFSNQLIKELHQINKTGNALIYQTASNRLQNYANNYNLLFKDINYTFLEGFKRQLITENVKQNSISNYLRTIRAIYNKAIKAKIIDRAHYPFTEVTIKTERTAKRAVLINDIQKLYKLKLKENSREWHARNYFFLSFSLIGISFSDMAYLKPANIVQGRLIYRRRKTHKEYSIKLTSIAHEIINRYNGKNEKYIIPILPSNIIEDSLLAKKYIRQWIKTTNKWMNKLGEECELTELLTTYVARHTWATTAKRMGFSNELIAEAMGHEYGNKITNIYLDNFDQNVIDELNEKVISQL